MNVISASRRTDIPAFYTGWLMERLRQGEVFVRQPYGGALQRVSLRPGDTSAIVFWSKDFSPLLPRLSEIEKTTGNLFFHYTITGVPHDIEPKSPPPDVAVRDFVWLAKRYSPARVVWRFDPVCLTNRLPFEYYEDAFSRIAERLQGFASKCYISFVHKYKKTIANIERQSGHTLLDVQPEVQKSYATRLSKIAASFGISLFACSSSHLVSDTVQKGSCINGAELSAAFKGTRIPTAPAPTRPGCHCTRSIDIGAYNTCPHGCLYCYANSNPATSRNAFDRQTHECNALGSHVTSEEFPEPLLFR